MTPEDSARIRDETIAKYQNYVNPSALNLLKLGGFDQVEWEGEGAILRDANGRDYIDCLGGYGVFSLGHRHREVVAAVMVQLQSLPLSSKTFLNKPLADLSEELARITPGDLQYSFLCNSGAEAVEAALKFARKATGKTKIVTAQGSYHGKTMGALSASGRDLYKTPFAPLLPGFEHVPFGDVAALESAVDEETAAVLLEPIQGENGVRIPPHGYLRAAREITQKQNALLVLDEVQTGLGRTGKLFACNHEDVAPDMMTLAKALGGGVMPIGAVVGTAAVWNAVFHVNPFIHSSTFGGNQLACAAALAALKVIQRDDLPAQAHAKGAVLLSGLQSLHGEFPDLVADIRGRGLLIGVEFFDSDIAKLLIGSLSHRGVIAAYTLNNPTTLRFEPPLIISHGQIETVVAAVKDALSEVRELLSDFA